MKKVELFGERFRQFEVRVDEQALRRHGIGLQDVADALRAAGQEIPGGEVATAGGTRRIVVDAPYAAPADVYNVVVRRFGDGSLLRVRDVIDITESGFRDMPGTVLPPLADKPQLRLKFRKNASANAIDVKEHVVTKSMTCSWSTLIAASMWCIPLIRRIISPVP